MTVAGKARFRHATKEKQAANAIFKNSLRMWQAQWKAQKAAQAAAGPEARNASAPGCDSAGNQRA